MQAAPCPGIQTVTARGPYKKRLVSMNIPVIVLCAVFTLIAVRRAGNLRLGLWQIMLLGAVAVLVTGQIGPREALGAIDPDIMLFLFGMFVVGQALEESGYLFHLSYLAFRRAGSADGLILSILFGFGIASAFLMNDTLAVIGTPLVLLLAKQHRMSPKVLLLALAFAVTIGSVVSPIGNPQNLLVAIHGRMPNPFVEFFRLTWIALIAAAPILFLSPKRWRVVRSHRLAHAGFLCRDVRVDGKRLDVGIFPVADGARKPEPGLDRNDPCRQRAAEPACLQCSAGGVDSADADARRDLDAGAARAGLGSDIGRQSFHSGRREQCHYHSERRAQRRSQLELCRIRARGHSADAGECAGLLAVSGLVLILNRQDARPPENKNS